MICKLDTETVGFTGPIVIIQYQLTDFNIHHVWTEPAGSTLNLIEELIKHRIVGYNLTYDSFHLAKIYNILRLVKDKDKAPIVEEVKEIEKEAWNGVCLKPPGCIDLFLLLKENVFSFLNPRKSININ